MELNIYKKDGSLKLTVSPSDSSTVTEEVGGECSVSLSFDTFEFRPIEVNDYIEVTGVRYKARMAYRPKMKNRQSYSYSLRFYAPIHDAEQVLMKTETDGGLISEFSLWGGPREHLQKWVDNMNRLAGSELWTIGSVITGENKNIDYQNVNCWDAAFGSNGIAATYETEMWADGYVINLCKCERGERVTLGYGNGLTGLTPEDNSDKVRFFTRLYPLGSTRNIDVSTYGFSRLQLPSRATFVDHNTDRYGVFEDSEEAAFADIYPQYIGTVTAVRSQPKTDENGKQFTVYYIKDSGMTWEPQALPEKNFMLSFQTGDLQGYGDDTDKSFQAEWHKDTKEWEIINIWLDENTQVPGGNIVPITGNQYFPWNMIMPQEYITDAQNRYAAAVNDFVANYSGEPVAYSGSTDYIHCAKQAVPLRIGQNVRLESDLYFEEGYQNTRITKVVRKLCRLTDATVTFAEQIGTGWKKSVDNQLSSLHYEMQRQAEQAGVDVIKTTDTKTPSDNNVYSALHSLATFLRKDKADSTSHLLTLLAGAVFGENKAGIDANGAARFLSAVFNGGKASIGSDGAAKLLSAIFNGGKASIAADGAAVLLSAIFNGGKAKIDSDGAAKFRSILLGTGIETENFSTGTLGSGFCIKKDENGDTYLEVDRMLVRKVATFIELLIQRLRYVGGQIILTPASMACIKVEDKGTYYRCYFSNTDGDKTIKQEFVVGDQARSQTFNIKEGVSQNVSNTYYWRLVVGVGDDYIDLSKADCDAGSTVPASGDDIVQLGNRTDSTRQAAIILAAYGNDAPYIKMYKGINSYVMDGKEFCSVSRSGVRINSDMFMLSTQNGNQSVDGIINNAIDGVVISGVNILADSDNGLLDKLKVYPDNVTKYAYSDNDGWRRISLLAGDLTGNQIVQEKYTTTETGRDFTLSVLLRTDGTISSAPYFRFRDRSTRYSKDVTAVIEPREQGTYRLWATCKDGLTDNLLVFQIMNLGTSGASYVEFRYPQLEYGNKPTEWRESPDDLGARLQVLDDRITAEVHSLEVADKNLLVGSDIDLLSRASGYNLGASGNNTVIKTDDGWWRVNCPNGVSNGEFLIPDLLRLTKGVTYTESIEIRSDAALTAEIRFYSTYGDYQKINSEQIVIEPYHWRLVGTFTFKEAGIRIIDVARISAPNATYVEFRFPMLTEGDSYVPWQPAAEDETDTRTHLTKHDSEIRQMANEITLRVTKTEYDQNNNEIGKQLSEIKQTADSITSTVQKEISNLTIGSRNYIRNTAFEDGTNYWGANGVTIAVDESNKRINVNTLKITQSTASDSGLTTIRIYQNATKLSTASLSFWAKANKTVSLKIRLGNNQSDMKTVSLTTSWQRYVFENIAPESEAVVFGALAACTWWLSEPMLALGTKASDWSPAPKDVDDSLTALSSEIKQTADSITSTVQKEINNLTIGGDNCISNSDFSNGTSGWSFSNVTISVDSSVRVSGINTLRVVQSSASDTNLDSTRIFQYAGLSAGDTVSFSCWVRASVSTKIKIRLCGGTENSKEFSVGTSWTYIIFENVRASSNALILGTLSACTWYLSEPMLVQANKATSWAKRLSEQRTEISTIKQTANSISLKVDQIGDGLDATGIDITNKKIDITADKLSIKTNSGNSVAIFDGTGDVPKLKADYIDAKNLSVSHLQTNNTEIPVKLNINGDDSTIYFWGLDVVGLHSYQLNSTMSSIYDADGKGILGAYWKIDGYRKNSKGGMSKLYAIFSNEEIVMIDTVNNCRCRFSPNCIMLESLSGIDGSINRSLAFGASGTQIYAEGKYYSGYNGMFQGQLVRDGIICSNDPLDSPYYEIKQNEYLT